MAAFPEHTPLRILMTADTVGGVWTYCMGLCRSLQPSGVHFYLITMGAPLQPAQKADVEALENVVVYETDFKLEWMEQPWENIDASGNWLLKLEAEVQPDLIHLNAFAYGALPWKAPAVVVAHSDVWSWWRAVKGEQPPPEWNEYYRRVREGLEGANHLIAPSHTMLKAVQEIYKTTTPAAVIYNGRNAAEFTPAAKEPFVFSMGRIWDEAKNIRLLTAAAPLIQYPIRIAGDSQFAGNQHRKEGSNITYLGRLAPKEVAAQLAAASVYVLPAKYEPFGLSILEAALSGCALVVGATDSLQEIWVIMRCM
jgi:glycosyltransferase involved in cell wall biosynthesis